MNSEDRKKHHHWLYRLTHYYQIQTKEPGVTSRLKLNPIQQVLCRYLPFWTFFLVLKARQEGVSTLFLLWHLDATMFRPNTKTCILADERDNLSGLFGIIKFAYESCPVRIQLADGTVWRKPKAKYDMGAVIHAFGITGPLLDDMSTQLAKLAVDMASFHNTADEDAFMALRSGLTGETEPLKRFGIVLTDTNLKLFALEKGIKQKVEAMNQAQKTALRYAFIMEKTSQAQGDAARTAGSFANQSRRLSGEWTTLSEELGKGITPVLAQGLGVLSQALETTRLFVQALASDISSLLGLLGQVPGAGLAKKAAGFVSDAAKRVLDPFGLGGLVKSRVSNRLGEMKAAEPVAGPQTRQDALRNFGALGGGITAPRGGGAGSDPEKLANDLEKAEKDILATLEKQSHERLDLVTEQREELMLRQRLGVFTAKEQDTLERLNRRLAFKKDLVEEATKAWEEQADEVKKVEDRIRDVNEKIVAERKELQTTLAEIDRDATKSRVDKAADLLDELKDLDDKIARGEGNNEREQARRREIEGSLAKVDPSVVAEGKTVAGLDEFGLIDREAGIKRKEAQEKADARIAELQAELSAEQQKLQAVEAAEAEKKRIVVSALEERRAATELNFRQIEEATELHIKTQVEQYNRLRAAQTGRVTPGFAGGGPVSGPGTTTSDSILASLSDGEFVINARATAMYRPLVEAINSMSLPRFAEGGAVTNKSASITINNHGRAAEVYADPRRARWHARSFLG